MSLSLLNPSHNVYDFSLVSCRYAISSCRHAVRIERTSSLVTKRESVLNQIGAYLANKVLYFDASM